MLTPPSLLEPLMEPHIFAGATVRTTNFDVTQFVACLRAGVGDKMLPTIRGQSFWSFGFWVHLWVTPRWCVGIACSLLLCLALKVPSMLRAHAHAPSLSIKSQKKTTPHSSLPLSSSPHHTLPYRSGQHSTHNTAQHLAQVRVD